MNEYGYAQVGKSVSSITAISFPPYACCGPPETEWSPGYGKIENLLEVVSTYLHEVAGMNAKNVHAMRAVADLRARRGDLRRATELRADAKNLSDRINRDLYVEGKGTGAVVRWMGPSMRSDTVTTSWPRPTAWRKTFCPHRSSG
jgi:hypothetical protein